MIFAGIDPGVSGAIGIIDGKDVRLFDTPTMEIEVNKSVKRILDRKAACLIFEELTRKDENVYVTIEKASAMMMPNKKAKVCPVCKKGPSMGATSAFNYGRDYGCWLMLFDALAIPYSEIHPATWKKLVMANMQPGKDASRMRAGQLYPSAQKEITRKKDHGRAEALLIAHFGKMTYTTLRVISEQQRETIDLEPRLF